MKKLNNKSFLFCTELQDEDYQKKFWWRRNKADAVKNNFYKIKNILNHNWYHNFKQTNKNTRPWLQQSTIMKEIRLCAIRNSDRQYALSRFHSAMGSPLFWICSSSAPRGQPHVYFRFVPQKHHNIFAKYCYL
jgi:hypothetical protein